MRPGSESRLCPVLDVPLQENHLILPASVSLPARWGQPMGLLQGLTQLALVKCLAHSNRSNGDIISTSLNTPSDHIITSKSTGPPNPRHHYHSYCSITCWLGGHKGHRLSLCQEAHSTRQAGAPDPACLRSPSKTQRGP